MATRFIFLEFCSIEDQLKRIVKKNFNKILETQEAAKNSGNRRDDITFFPWYKKVFRFYQRMESGSLILQGIVNTDGFTAKGASK